jgi:DNA (cytosine-5)-methyltransferase 1
MTATTVGSLCTGIAGLEHGLTLAGLNTDTVFVSDIDKGACKWLEANVSAPNLGDFTALDELPPVHILTAGFPCQPLSTAGLRKGVEDERWLFDDICRLVGRMGTRPVLFLENVPGLLSANNGDAMARVVHGLAAIGYSITWGTMAAAAVGAPHRRVRWWGLAYPADTDSGRPWQGRTKPSRVTVPQHAADAVTDADGLGSYGFGRLNLVERDADRCDGEGTRSRSAVFGGYWPAVARWERIVGRSAPAPTVDGRLSPHLVEWMMGYPEGWVTDTLTNRRQALHALGNAVVPQCAAAAFTALAARVDDQAADGRSQTPAARSLTRW